MRSQSHKRSIRPPDAALRLALAAALGALMLAGCAALQPVKPVGPLHAPANVHVVADDGELTISWATQANASRYLLYWSAKPGATRATATKLGEPRKPPYTHSGLTNGQEVYYLLIAVNDTGESKPTAFRAKPLKVSVLKFEKHLAVIVQPTDTYSWLASRFLKDPAKGWMIQDYNALDGLTAYRAITIPLQQWRIGGLAAGEFQTVPVLTYHRFSTDGTANATTVPAAKFEAQMRFLAENDYRVVSLDQFVDFLEFKTQLPERAVVITADDGWKSFYEVAYPILRKYGYPSTIFVYTDFPESDELALTWPMIKEMALNGVNIECHTKSHGNLRMQRGEDFRKYVTRIEGELKSEQEIMKRKAGVNCRYLAYPYGGRNPLVLAMTQKYGFRAAFTVTRGSNSFFTQDYLVRRSMIYGEYSLKDFENNLKVSAELK